MWLIIILLVVCTGLSAAATKLWLMYAPFYTASALLVVSPPETEYGPMGRQPIIPADVIERYKLSVARTAKSDPVFNKTLEDPDVKRTRWYAFGTTPPFRLCRTRSCWNSP
jgi:hypothetical protein